MLRMNQTIVRVVGFCAGLIAGIAVELALFISIDAIFQHRMMPRGPGWLVFPLILALQFAASAPGFIERAKAGHVTPLIWFRAAPFPTRAMVIGPIFWVIVVAAFVWLFSPFGEYMSDDDTMSMIKVMLFPPVVAIAGFWAYQRLVKKPPAA